MKGRAELRKGEEVEQNTPMRVKLTSKDNRSMNTWCTVDVFFMIFAVSDGAQWGDIVFEVAYLFFLRLDLKRTITMF